MTSPLRLQHQKSLVVLALAVLALAASFSCSEAFVPVALRNGRFTQSHLSPSLSLSPGAFQLVRLQASADGDTNSNGAISSTNNAPAPALLLEKFDRALKNGKLREAEQIMSSSAATQSQSLPMNDARWDLIFNAIEERTRLAETEFYPEETKMENLRHTENLARLAEFPDVSASRSEMTDMYQALAKQQHLTLFGAVNVKQPVMSSISSRSLVTPELLEATIQLPMKALTPQATNSILWAGVTLAIVEGLVSSMANVPGLTLNVLVLMTLLLSTLDRLFLNGAILENYVKLFSPGMQQRIARHEAGHFLAAYLLGCPVEGVVLSAWEALKDDRFGGKNRRQVSAGTSFFDPELSQQMNSGLGMPQQQQQQQSAVTRSSIDRYSIIVMAGIAAEADYYGRADGGAGDEMALIAFLSQLNRKSSVSSPFLAPLMSSAAAPMPNQSWSPELIKSQARWGALQAVALLREYKPAYEALVDVLDKPGPTRLCDCIRAIETAAKEHNLKPTPAALAIRDMEQQQQQGLLASGKSGSGTTTNGAAAAAMTTTSSSSTKAAVSSPSSPEVMATTLQEYRSTVEKRLKEVEARLGELQEKSL